MLLQGGGGLWKRAASFAPQAGFAGSWMLVGSVMGAQKLCPALNA